MKNLHWTHLIRHNINRTGHNSPLLHGIRTGGVDFHLLRDDHFILNQKNSYFRTLEQDILNHYQFNPSRHMVSNCKGNAFLTIIIVLRYFHIIIVVYLKYCYNSFNSQIPKYSAIFSNGKKDGTYGF